MTQLRCTLFALLGLTLAACSEDKTIVAVNYSYGEGVAIKENNDTQVHIVITQGGQKFETTFATPLVPATEASELPDGAPTMVDIMVPDSAFFERYGDDNELSSFGAGKTELLAELLDGTTVLYTSKSTFDMREHGAVAAYAEFKMDPPDETSAPASSSSAAPSSSSAPTDAGSSEGNTTTDAASTSDAATSASDAATSAATDAATVPGEAGSSSDAATTGATDGSAAASDASTGG